MNQPYSQSPELADNIARNPVFSAIQNEVMDRREKQAMRWSYVYSTSGSVAGGATTPFFLTIEQGTDFYSEFITGSAFSYDAANATNFPIPNSAGLTSWAGRGLTVQIVDTRSSRNLTSGFVNFETLFTPGYGQNFQMPYPFKYYWFANSKIRFDIRNSDSSDRTHTFAIALKGYKILVPTT